MYQGMPNMRMGGGNQMAGYQNAPYYPQQPMNMGMGMQGVPQVGGGRRRGGIQAKIRQANQAAMIAQAN